MNETLAGSLAGLAATAPMTLSMEGMFTQLPRQDRYPLPPRQITEKVTKAVDLDDDLSEEGMQSATMLAHFGYGAAAGALYGAVARPYLPGTLGGVVFGLGVWTGSYLGLLPAINILPPATRAPASRNALMIAAHVVWGAALGYGTQKLVDAKQSRRA